MLGWPAAQISDIWPSGVYRFTVFGSVQAISSKFESYEITETEK